MLNRNLINKLRYVLEDLLPPALRDSVFFYAAMHLMFGRRTRDFTSFRPRSPYLTAEEYAQYYRSFPALLSDTDLNQTCIDRILAEVRGETLIDVGCGRGYFAALLAERTRVAVTAVDFIVDEELPARYPAVRWVEAPVETLPFDDRSFDTVICSHTLEHIVGFSRALTELRRICRRRLIIVVPKEREYRYSFNMHVNFFPYTHSLLNRLHPLPSRHVCEVLGGDLFYREDRD